MALDAHELRARLPQYSMWSLYIVMAVGAIGADGVSHAGPPPQRARHAPGDPLVPARAQRDALDQVVPAPS